MACILACDLLSALQHLIWSTSLQFYSVCRQEPLTWSTTPTFLCIFTTNVHCSSSLRGLFRPSPRVHQSLKDIGHLEYSLPLMLWLFQIIYLIIFLFAVVLLLMLVMCACVVHRKTKYFNHGRLDWNDRGKSAIYVRETCKKFKVCWITKKGRSTVHSKFYLYQS